MIRRAKVGVFQARRLLSWAIRPGDWTRPSVACGPAQFPHSLYHQVIALQRHDAGADPILDRGKQINVALAAPHFDGVILGPDQPLSLWRILGRLTASRGYQLGMELRGGCIVPTLGGGICLVSNALFIMACRLGWTIIERHGHTLEAAPPLPGMHPWGLDATVLWPHVDLRVAPRHGPVRLGMTVARGALTLRADAPAPARVRTVLRGVDDAVWTQAGQRYRRNRIIRQIIDRDTDQVIGRDVVAHNRKRLLHASEQRRSCLTCDQTACHARPRDLAGATPRPAHGAGGVA